MTTQAQPRTIRAAIHPEAIAKVSSFFNARTSQILNELLQNSRRAGATQVSLDVDHANITVSDNGRGIADPQALLSFGLSQWDYSTARSEHPAGMGLYSLARKDRVTIISKTADAPAWRVELTPAHFLGEAEAEVIPHPDRDQPGTSISFPKGLHTYNFDREAAEAARYYPLPVLLNGAALNRQDFLQDAVFVRNWRGLRIGVFNSGRNESLNFHGTVVQNASLPHVETIAGPWRAQVDVTDCPQLELTLPTRTHLVDTPFVDQLKDACLETILLAIARHRDPVDVPHKTQKLAGAYGISLPDARPLLEPWSPTPATRRRYAAIDKLRQVLPTAPIVVPNHLYATDQYALARAADQAGIAHRLVRQCRDFDGYQWYDDLMHLRTLDALIAADGKQHTLSVLREEEDYLDTYRADRILLLIRAKSGDGNRLSLGLPADLLFQNETQDDGPEDNLPLVAPGSGLDPKELTQLMMDAYFDPSSDSGSDSHETQEYAHQEAYRRTALHALTPPEDALREVLSSAINSHVRYLIPENTTVSIVIESRKNPRISLTQAA